MENIDTRMIEPEEEEFYSTSDKILKLSDGKIEIIETDFQVPADAEVYDAAGNVTIQHVPAQDTYTQEVTFE